MKDTKKVNVFLEQLNVTLASDMDRILDHFSNGDIQEEDLRAFIHQNVRFIIDFEFVLHQRRQRTEQAVSVALAQSNEIASIAVPSGEQPTITESEFHQHCTSNAKSISSSTCSNDTVSSPRSQETMQPCGSYDSFKPTAIESTPRSSNVQNGRGVSTRRTKRSLSPSADGVENAAKNDAAKAKNRRVTIDGRERDVQCPHCLKWFVQINKHRCKNLQSTSTAGAPAGEEFEEEFQCSMCLVIIKGRAPFLDHLKGHFPNEEMTDEELINNYKE